jgi:predicted nucleic acid-binding protein
MVNMKPRVYLDTSVISAYFDERWAERQQETLHFFQCAPAEYSLALSGITLFELRKTKDEKRRSEMLEFAAQI